NRIDLDIDKISPLEDVLAHAAFVLHPNLLQHFPRSRIMFEMSGEDTVQLSLLESVFHHLTCRLRGEPLAPVRNANPVAKLRTLVLRVRMQPDSAKESTVFAQSNSHPEFVLLGGAVEKLSCVVLGERMRNAQRGGSDSTIADQWDQFRDVGFAQGNEPQSLGFDYHRGFHVVALHRTRQGHSAQSCQKAKQVVGDEIRRHQDPLALFEVGHRLKGEAGERGECATEADYDQQSPPRIEQGAFCSPGHEKTHSKTSANVNYQRSIGKKRIDRLCQVSADYPARVGAKDRTDRDNQYVLNCVEHDGVSATKVVGVISLCRPLKHKRFMANSIAVY